MNVNLFVLYFTFFYLFLFGCKYTFFCIVMREKAKDFFGGWRAKGTKNRQGDILFRAKGSYGVVMSFFSKLFSKKPPEDTSMKYLIVGLGNIGDEYTGTRHNSGFMVIDRLVGEAGVKYVLERHAYRAEVKHKGRTLVVIRPTTYMNLSGKAVQYWMQKEHVDLERLLVVVDDIALPVGKMRLKKQGSSGGHNGLTNIEQLIHTSNYCRLRIGIGSNFGQGHQIDYVLGHFDEAERALLEPCLNRAVEAVKAFVTLGPDRAMNLYN